MTGQLDVIREGNLGIIALNRPEAINALSLEMIDGITRALEQWADDDEIRLVLFEGRGPRGFCSGGDVRAVRQAVLDGEAAEADAFFAAEYRMNGIIARYPKPLVALTHGIVMGGGIGIAGHCAFRFTTAEARFAMPEAAIGFTCDVGVNFILSKAPVHRALAFAMTGVPVGAADALALGLTDCAIDPARRDAVRAGIAAAAGAPRIEAALGALMQAEMAPVGEAVLCAAADRQQGLDWNDTEAIVGTAGREPQLAQLALRSPTSLVAIAESHHAARRLADIGAVLAADLRLARLLSRLPDFAEGVRAVLVDKDQKPAWRPNSLAGVDRASIRAVLGAA
ncbi:MAG: enoyl-CoA hydratase/isomerase family protein [Devosia sp.]|jgi:enoyl-CoA hydratase|nr:enoyl-CoA hydratase/isomerase family protein [Devosia sp.]